MHVGRKAYFRRLGFEVDLSEYLASGWHLKAGPHLYFHPLDRGDHQLCAKREMLDPDPAHGYDPRGIWRWTLEYVKDGVVDIVWDLVPPGPTVALEAPSAIKLHAGEHAVFGYGSLLSMASLERTLGRTYHGPLVVCDLIGWRRSWNVSMPNSTFAFQDSFGTWITPERVLYLNITPAPGKRVNGVLFIVGEADLRVFDQREWIYERVAVNDLLRGVTVIDGPAWAFVARPEHLLVPPTDPRQAAVRRTYLDMLNSGKADPGGNVHCKLR
jgi:cation transport regulator ChaC